MINFFVNHFPGLGRVGNPSMSYAGNTCGLASSRKAFSSSPCKSGNAKSGIAGFSANHLTCSRIPSLSLIRMRKHVDIHFMNHLRSIWSVKNCRQFHLTRLFSVRSEEHTSELQSRQYLVCRLLLEKKKNNTTIYSNINSPFFHIINLFFTTFSKSKPLIQIADLHTTL